MFISPRSKSAGGLRGGGGAGDGLLEPYTQRAQSG